MKTILCESCSDNGEHVIATWSAPSSANAGKTVQFSPVCDAHAAGWWDGADWDGRHLMQKLEQPMPGYTPTGRLVKPFDPAPGPLPAVKKES